MEALTYVRKTWQTCHVCSGNILRLGASSALGFPSLSTSGRYLFFSPSFFVFETRGELGTGSPLGAGGRCVCVCFVWVGGWVGVCIQTYIYIYIHKYTHTHTHTHTSIGTHHPSITSSGARRRTRTRLLWVFRAQRPRHKRKHPADLGCGRGSRGCRR